jgi:phosphoribosylaminoimidazole-succinocarboxamide synthase
MLLVNIHLVKCGVSMPDYLKENDKFPEPIITPTTKADNGEHDADISREDILSKGIVSEEDYCFRKIQRFVSKRN